MQNRYVHEILSLNDIIDKKISDINFLETVSLVFHGIVLLINEEQSWKYIYSQFLEDLKRQKKLSWPKLDTNNNEFNRRIDIFLSMPFIETNNILTLLHRLLYIETYKLNIIVGLKYKNILEHIVINNNNCRIREISLFHLFELLADHLKYYTRIYNDKNKLEFSLGNKILKIIQHE